jgi:sugar O-acyltransferase (sialic acid O-acetyltransferase NeuD family)
MKKKLVIFGADIMAKIVYEYFSRDSEYQVVAFTVDERYRNNDTYLELPLVSFENIEEIYPASEFYLFIAIGTSKMNENREVKYNHAKSKKYRLASYISPFAICDSEIGDNTIVADMSIIRPCVKIGNNNYFWEQCFIAGDSIVGNNCSFSVKSVVSTFSQIEDNVILGTGAIVKTSIKVSKKTLAGAASYISSNTKENGVYGEKSTPLAGCISDKINISI